MNNDNQTTPCRIAVPSYAGRRSGRSPRSAPSAWPAIALAACGARRRRRAPTTTSGPATTPARCRRRRARFPGTSGTIAADQRHLARGPEPHDRPDHRQLHLDHHLPPDHHDNGVGGDGRVVHLRLRQADLGIVVDDEPLRWAGHRHHGVDQPAGVRSLHPGRFGGRPGGFGGRPAGPGGATGGTRPGGGTFGPAGRWCVRGRELRGGIRLGHRGQRLDRHRQRDQSPDSATTSVIVTVTPTTTFTTTRTPLRRPSWWVSAPGPRGRRTAPAR